MDELTTWAGPLHVMAVLLLLSGAHKLVEPAAASRAMRGAGVPGPLARGRLVGATELLVGAWVLAFGGPAAAAGLGLLYGAFLLFLLVLRRREPEAPCGCFGVSETPPGASHLVVDAAAVVVAGLAAVAGPVGVPEVVGAATSLELVAYLTLVAAGAGLLHFGIDAYEDIRLRVREVGGS